MTRTEKTIAVLEVIISKLYLAGDEFSYMPEIVIRDIDIQATGMNFHAFTTCLSYLAELKVFDRNYVSQPFVLLDDPDDIEEQYNSGYQIAEIKNPDLRFKLHVFGNPWKVYENLNQGILMENITTDELAFDEKNSILNVRGFGVKVSRQADKSIDHFILKHIFDTDPKETYAYGELKTSGVYDHDTDKSTYLNACKTLNKKIKESTNGRVEKFLLHGSSPDGSVQINPIYLD